MKLWVLDTNLLIDVMEGEPARKAVVQDVASSADLAGARLAISAITVQEYLVLSRTHALDTYHQARQSLNAFLTLQYDQAAAEEAAKIEIQKALAAYRVDGASRSTAKAAWFRDAAIIGTAVARGAERVFTRDGPMMTLSVPGVRIERV